MRIEDFVSAREVNDRKVKNEDSGATELPLYVV